MSRGVSQDNMSEAFSATYIELAPMSTYPLNPADDCRDRNIFSNPPTCTSQRFLLSFLRNFLATNTSNYSTNVWFWEIRQRGPPPEDLMANTGDIYLDTSTVPLDVYQKTTTGWTLCWSELPGLNKKEFSKLPHPCFKNYFLWTAQNIESEISLSYITLENLNCRGGTEIDQQFCLLEDLKTFYPSITTAETLIARRDAALHAKNGSSLSPIVPGVGNGSDSMSMEEDLFDEDDDLDTDETNSNVPDDDFVDNMVVEDSGRKFTMLGSPSLAAEGSVHYESISPVQGSGSCSSTSYSLGLESESISSIILQLTRAIDKERKQHATETDKCE